MPLKIGLLAIVLSRPRNSPTVVVAESVAIAACAALFATGSVGTVARHRRVQRAHENEQKHQFAWGWTVS